MTPQDIDDRNRRGNTNRPGCPGRRRRALCEVRTVSVIVHPARLRREMTRRGWDAFRLSREARLSPATVSAALAGRPIAARSLTMIADALLHAPVLGVIDALIMDEAPERDLG